MTPELQLILGCLLLSLLVAYAWWTKLRILYFQLDVLKIVREIQDASPSPGSRMHPMSVLTIGVAEIMVHHADLLSVSVLRSLKSATAENAEAFTFDESLRPFFRMLLDRGDWPKAVEPAIAKLVARLVVFVFFETFSGWAYLLIQVISGKWKTAFDRMGRAIRMIPTAEETRWLGNFLSTGMFRG